MPAWGVILLIVVACFLPGWLITKQLSRWHVSVVWQPLEMSFVAVALGVGAMGWVALVLAELGWFSLGRLTIIWLVLVGSLSLVIWKYRSPDRSNIGKPAPEPSPPFQLPLPFLPAWFEFTALGIWLAMAVWLFFRPHQFITGAADAGVYVNLGANIAQSGRILIQDETLAELNPNLYPVFLRSINNSVAPAYILPAFYVVGEPPGEITPQFYPLHPVWQAVAFSLGADTLASVTAELFMTGFWALLGSLAIYLVVRQLANWQVAFLALIGLSINALQIWFARYPTAEALSQYLLWTGLWSLGVWLSGRKPQPLWALLAGLALGQLFLVRIDTLFILPILVLFGLWLWLWDTRPDARMWFVMPLLLLIGHSLMHGWWQSRPYFLDLFSFGVRLLRVNPLILLAASGAGVMALWSVGRFRHQFGRLTPYQRPVLLLIMMLIFSLAAYGWFIRPYVTPVQAWNDPYSASAVPLTNHENLWRLGWYLSPLGVWLGVVGVTLLVWQVNRKTIILLAITLLFSTIYLWNIHANGHQIYAMRRYVIATMPLFIMAAAYFLGWLMVRKKQGLMAISLLLVILWLSGLASLARGFVSQVDYQGMITQIDELQGLFEPRSVLLFNDPSPISYGDVIGTPLRFLYHHDVFTLRQPVALDVNDLTAAIAGWQAKGRAVYWITIPGVENELLHSEALSFLQSYTLVTTLLESSYDHRPTAVLDVSWPIDIYIFQSLPTTPLAEQ